MRLMDVAKRMSAPVRWRMAPPGVAADAYLVHRFSIAERTAEPLLPATRASSAWNASVVSSYASSIPGMRKLSLDSQGWHRGRPVCVLGEDVDTSKLDDDELAPLSFPDALAQLERGLNLLVGELTGSRMLYAVGEMAWEQRAKWPTHHLHVVENGQLIAVIDPQNWQFHLLDACTVERMAGASMVTKPRIPAFAAQGFRSFMFETALWEFAKRCPEVMLDQMLPAAYLAEPLTHRRAPHLKAHSLGDHCVAILRALDTHARTADDLQKSLRMTRPSLLRAVTCLALVRAIQPESRSPRGLMNQLNAWWMRITGKTRQSSALRSSQLRVPCQAPI
jgi:hypothetical protein